MNNKAEEKQGELKELREDIPQDAIRRLNATSACN